MGILYGDFLEEYNWGFLGLCMGILAGDIVRGF